MQENRNNCCGNGNAQGASCRTAIIDTNRVLDTCKDRDCFENTRVYLTSCGEQILGNSSNLRTKSARLIGAYVGLNEVPFNCGFYQVRIRYYVEIDFVVNKLDSHVYIQSAFQMLNEEKVQLEIRPLTLTQDFFKKIIITNDILESYYDENGVFHCKLVDFLLGKVNLI